MVYIKHSNRTFTVLIHNWNWIPKRKLDKENLDFACIIAKWWLLTYVADDYVIH